MTLSFLKIIAKDLFTRTNGHLENLTVVFPNKRAKLFLNQHLAEISNGPIWSPKYITISDLFQSMSSLNIADSIVLLSYLYETYKSVTNNDETFDHFYSWGEVLLKDFENIDSYMVNHRTLFANIADLEAMTSFDYLSEEQLNAIKHFFTTFNKNEKTELHMKFSDMWNHMPYIYEKFHEILEKNNIAYEGMLKRNVIENFDNKNINSNTTYVFIGFNILSQTEKELFKQIKRNAPTLFYWDYNKDLDSDKSSLFIQQNIILFGQDFKYEKDSNIASSPKIQILSSSTDNIQCKYIGQWIKETINKKEPLNKTAIILCNENLLNSVLNSIPSNDKDGNNIQYNITMGYPLQETPVSSYIMNLLNLQSKGWKDDNTIKYKAVIQLLQHPFVMKMTNKNAYKLLKNIKENNLIYPNKKLFEDDPILKHIFTRYNDCHSTIEYIRDCIIMVTKFCSSKSLEKDNQLLNESLFNGYTMMNRLYTISKDGRLPIQNIEILTRLIKSIIQSISIPFHGEPALGVQIMGILETRNLDFNNIIMISMEEGIMPKIQQQSSFIPYTLKKAHNMPTIEHNDCIYAYYFYRLFHNAKNITLLYNNTTEGLHKGEMSRYLMQLKLKGVPCGEIVSPNIQENKYAQIHVKDTDDTAINKVQTSPSALNNYIECPYKYYLKYICGLKESDSINEEIDNADFGSIFHYVMEQIYKPFIGRGEIQNHQIIQIKNDEISLQKLIDKAFTKILNKEKNQHPQTYSKQNLDGEMLLTYEVITKYVKKQLELDSNLCPMEILAVEKDISQIPIENYNEITDDFKFSGIIDREDIVTINDKKIHRIVDYKTSTKENNKANDVKSLFRHDCFHTNYVFQTLYYCEALIASGCKEQISPALIFIKKNNSEMDYGIKINNEIIYDYNNQCRKEFQENLKQLIIEIQNPQNCFTKVQNEASCAYCPFSEICMINNNEITNEEDD